MMENKQSVHFVWLLTNGKLFPQKWFDEMLSSHNKKPMHSDDVLKFKQRLADDEIGLTLDQLMIKYPAPIIEEKSK